MMKQLVVALLMLSSLSFLADPADAKRMGSGRNVGMQRNDVVKREAPPPAQTPASPAQQPAASQASHAPQPAAAQPARSGMSRWLGPLAGLAAGIGLAALLSHFGLGEGFASVLMLLLLVGLGVLAFRMWRRRSRGDATPALASAAAGSGAAAYQAHDVQLPASAPPPQAVPRSAGFPPDFDAAAFAHQAKVNFVRLQAAHDAGNVDDLREFTTPEMYAELSVAIQERGAARDHTEVVTLDAEVLDVTEEPQRYVVSVRYTGMLRETEGGVAQAFDEVWHLVKPRTGKAGWVVAGIEQRQ